MLVSEHGFELTSSFILMGSVGTSVHEFNIPLHFIHSSSSVGQGMFGICVGGFHPSSSCDDIASYKSWV